MANCITCIRILCGLSLLFCPTFSIGFFIFYLIGWGSDVLDGWIARYTRKESEIGAKLDTAADILLVFAILFKTIRAVRFPAWLLIWIGVIALIKGCSIVSGFVIQKRFVAVHSILNKLCGVMLFLIPLCLPYFGWQTSRHLIVFTCTLATLAAMQEGQTVLRGMTHSRAKNYRR